MKKLLYPFSIVFIFLFSNSYSQDAAYTMTATTKTITSCRSTLDAALSCVSAGKVVYCANLDRSYTFVSGSGTVLNANLTLHILDDDFIYVYDGPSSASPLLATWTGGTTLDFTTGLNATSTGSVITIRFVSNASGGTTFSGPMGSYYSGWSILIGCPPTNCNGNLPADDNCTAAPQICNLTGYCGNTSGWYNEDNGQLEGQAAPGFGGSIENNSWINFVASATTSTLVVTSANCLTAGSGIQGAVYKSTNCSTFTPVSGGNFNQSTAAGTVTLNLTGLTAGQDYYLMLDGYGGNVCDYTVTASGNVQVLNTTSSSASNTICPNQSFTVTASSGATSYSWNPAPASTSSNTAVYNNISSTSVITTTAFGYCGASATVALTMSVVPLAISVTSATICSGTSTVLTASGATTYTWAPATSLSATTGATVTASPTANIVYTVTGTSGICTATNNSTVTVNPTPTISVNSSTICSGTSTVLTASGGTTYSWTPGTNLSATTGATVTASPTVTIVYTVTGTTTGCSSTKTSTVTVNPTPTITVNSPTICSGTSTVLTANGGAAGTTYSWSPGTNLSATTGSAVTSSATTTIQYTVTATLNGCSSSKISTLTVNATPTITVNSPTICSGTSTVLTANGGAAGTTYTWSPGTSLSATTGSAVTSSATTTIQYTVTATLNGCSGAATSTLTVNATPTITVNSPTICSGTSTVLIASGGAVGTTYTWSPATNLSITTGSIVTASPTTTIQYTVTATLNGCSSSKTSTVTVNPIPTTTASASGPINCSTPTITLNSTLAGVSYTWSAPIGGILGTANSQNTSASGAGGVYTLNVQSAAGCTFSTTISVTQSTVAPVGFTAGSNQTLTCGSSSVTLTGSIGIPANATLNWTGPNVCGTSTTIVTSACGAGIYTLTATDPTNGCIATPTVQVFPSLGSPSVTANAPSNSITCTNTLVTISVSTTVTPVTYTWSGTGILAGNGTGTLVVTQGGTFIYSVTAAGCTTSGNIFVVTNTTVPTTTATVAGVITCSTSTVALNSTLAGMNYTWTAPSGASVSTASTQSTIGTGIGTYSLTVVNPSNGCTFSTSVTVTQNTTPPTLTLSPTSVTLSCLSNTVQLTATTTDTDVSYLWSTNGSLSSSTISNPIATGSGTYNVIVTNTLTGCQANETATVTSNTTPPTLTLSPMSATLSCVTNTVQLTATTTNTDVSYSWSTNGSLSSSTISNPIATGSGTYNVIVTNTLTGCQANETATVTSNTTPPTLTLSPMSVTLSCVTNTVQLTATTTNTDVSYSWTTNGSLSNSTISNPIATGSGTYNVIVTNTLTGCQANETATVTQNPTPPTLTLSPMSFTLSCVSNTVQLVATTTDTDVAYSWTTNGSLSSSTISNPIATGSGTYNVIVTNTLTGCQATETATITSNTTPPTLTLSPMSFTLTCASPTIQLVATTTDTNVSYSWTTNGSLNSSAIFNPIATGSGTYNVIVTNTLTGCQSTETATLTQNSPSPTLTLSPMTFTLSCVSNTVQLVATTTDTDVSYSWTTNGSLSNSTISNPIATGSGTYNVIVTNTITGCQSNATATVTSNTTPPTLTLSPMSVTLSCLSNTVQLTAATTDTDVSYSWTTNGSLSSSTISNPIATGSGTYNVIVTNTLTGCQANTTATVISNTTPPNLTLSPMSFVTTCNTTTVQLIATTTDTDVSYAWTTNGSLSNSTISNPIATGSGTYNVIVTNTLTGCQANETATVTSNTTPPTLTLSPMSFTVTCATPTVQLIATTTDTDVSYSWITNGSLSSNTISNPIATGSGTYNVIVTNTLTGCQANETATITSNTTPPSVSVTNTVIPCGSPSVAIEAISTNVTYNWTTSGTGSILSVTNMSTAVAGSAGQYIVTVSDNTNGCTNTGTVNVTSTGITAAFTANPLSGTAPLLVNFTNQSTPGSLSSWSFADNNNNTSTLTDPSHVFNTTGNYVVTLIATDATGLCSATATLSIEVFENATVIIPNVFTPNGDGSNDLFKVTTTGIKELTCDIFNRWGTKLYTIKNISDSWDGSGAADGTYFFIFQATGFDSKEFKQQGFISLFR